MSNDDRYPEAIEIEIGIGHPREQYAGPRPVPRPTEATPTNRTSRLDVSIRTPVDVPELGVQRRGSPEPPCSEFDPLEQPRYIQSDDAS